MFARAYLSEAPLRTSLFKSALYEWTYLLSYLLIENSNKSSTQYKVA